jgi:hypothetical protein
MDRLLKCIRSVASAVFSCSSIVRGGALTELDGLLCPCPCCFRCCCCCNWRRTSGTVVTLAELHVAVVVFGTDYQSA